MRFSEQKISSKFPIVQYPSTQDFFPTSKLKKKNYHFHKVVQKQNCNACVFTQLAMILPHASVIRVETGRICDAVAVHVSKIFYPSIYCIT